MRYCAAAQSEVMYLGRWATGGRVLSRDTQLQGPHRLQERILRDRSARALAGLLVGLERHALRSGWCASPWHAADLSQGTQGLPLSPSLGVDGCSMVIVHWRSK